ncbi:MAG: cytochrome c [Gammaproteobacteria bacterium]|nr:cytochrome c [Pseudomonadales bacterium]MCP5348099.1 cytochrome c [Pseudomonadales bacterium]
MIKRVLTVGLITLGSSFLLVSSAQDGPTPEQQAQQAMETRQSVFRLFRYNLGTISGMARGTVEFDAAIAERNARRIAAMAPMIPELFQAMDTREFDLDTEALPVIWEQFDLFQERAQALVDGANEFADIAAGGDRMETLGAIRAFGANCGNCHETFRVDD